MRFSKEIQMAVLYAADELGSQKKLAEAAGMAQSHINGYANGKTNRINRSSWTKLSPYISKYLPDDFMRQPAGSHKEYGRTAGKLEVIADMLRNVIAPAVPENMKPVVATMAGSLNNIAEEINNPGAFDSTGKE